MPTPLDRALQTRSREVPDELTFSRVENFFFGFTGLVFLASMWTLFNGEMFPSEPEPTGNPDEWTKDECRRWLKTRNLHPEEKASREFLLERVKVNMS